MSKLAMFVVVISLFGCGKKDEAKPADKAGAAETKPTEAKTEAKPVESKPAGPVDAAALEGTWTMVDRPQISWTFKAGGATHIKTSVTEYDGEFELKGNALTLKAKDLAGSSEYVVVAVSADKLRLKDANSSSITEFKK